MKIGVQSYAFCFFLWNWGDFVRITDCHGLKDSTEERSIDAKLENITRFAVKLFSQFYIDNQLVICEITPGISQKYHTDITLRQAQCRLYYASRDPFMTPSFAEASAGKACDPVCVLNHDDRIPGLS
jgi:hypothetical protein